ncbi:MAG: lipopolysaccharide biosynthesis protein [Flavobacteriales bacterium]|nr:lipopolysaccharide biosynthesis protein [Flavobacteriales bacterium]
MKVPAIGSFRWNVMTLMGGSAVAQVIPLLATPIMTRLYAPEQFGALALLLAVANPLSLLVCGRYEMTVVLPRTDREANTLVQISLGVAVLVTLILGVGLWSVRPELIAWMGVKGPGIGTALSLSPLLFFFMGAFQPLNNWLVRKQAFKAMSVNRIMQTSAITLVSLALGYWAVGSGLVFGYIAGWALYLIMGRIQAAQKGFRLWPVEGDLIRSMMRRYASFPLYNALPAVLNTATLSVPVLMLTRLFDEEATGQFNLCRQAIFLPGMFIASAFMQVYVQHASATVSDGRPVGPGLRRLLRPLILLGGGLALVLMVAGPLLFQWVFGDAWEQAGGLARIMAIPFAMQFVVVPMAVVLPALDRIKAYSIWQVFYFVLVFGIGFMGHDTPETYVTALAIIESLCFLGLGVYLFTAVRDHDAHLDPVAP